MVGQNIFHGIFSGLNAICVLPTGYENDFYCVIFLIVHVNYMWLHITTSVCIYIFTQKKNGCIERKDISMYFRGLNAICVFTII